MPRVQSDQLSRTVAASRSLPRQTSASAHPRRCHREDRDTANEQPRRFLTGPQVCTRYSITDMSLWRWLKDPVTRFPQPTMRVKNRRYWLEADLVAWERAQVSSATSAAAE
jgi:predicted DNA-binding transcriptional regulator AlpA